MDICRSLCHSFDFVNMRIAVKVIFDKIFLDEIFDKFS